jgi:predicted ATP-grasp superfamily ATP-dependent carboligase
MIAVLVYEFASGGGFGAAAPTSILGEGRAMRDAVCRDLAAAGEFDVVAATAIGESVPFCARSVSPQKDESAPNFLRRVAIGMDVVCLIAPESDGISLELTRLLESIDANIIGCGSVAIALASSKSRTLARLDAAGIDCVPTWPLAEVPLRLHETWVVKPDRGCGCEGIRRLGHRDIAALRVSDAEAMIVQPWLDGEAMSLSLLVNRHNDVEIVSINRQHIDVAEQGALSLAGITRGVIVAASTRTRLQKLAAGIVASIEGLRGFVGVDFILDRRGTPVVLEVNPRLTSAYVGLSEQLGRNLAGDILRATLPELQANG